MSITRIAARLAVPRALRFSPETVHRLLRPHLAGLRREHLWRVDLGARDLVLGAELVSIGTVDTTVAHPREIFTGALIAAASAIVLVHNHISGELEPSAVDVRTFDRLDTCGVLLGIAIRDQLIVHNDRWFSLKSALRSGDHQNGSKSAFLR